MVIKKVVTSDDHIEYLFVCEVCKKKHTNRISAERCEHKHKRKI